MMFVASVVEFICDVVDGKAEYCYVAAKVFLDDVVVGYVCQGLLERSVVWRENSVVAITIRGVVSVNGR